VVTLKGEIAMAENKEPVEQPESPKIVEGPKDEATETKEVVEEVVEKTKQVPKKVTCPRCKGDGWWHSSRTGVRVKTASEPLVDESRPCPQCKGRKSITILIPEAQARAEHAAKAARRKADNAAKQARAAANRAEAAAKRAEAKV